MISSIVTRLIKQLSTTTRSQSIRQFLNQSIRQFLGLLLPQPLGPVRTLSIPSGDKHRAPNDTRKRAVL